MTNQTSSTRRAGILRWTALAALPLAAAAVAYFATRGPVARQAEGHDHSTMLMGAAGDSARAVMLTADQARRIGVTYAVASIRPLEREIRTVGQVTYDETRVATVSLKIDGWVEQLHVNFTGQAVSQGTPLLAIYSPMLVSAQEELLLARRLADDVAQGSAEARANAASLLSSARRRLAWWDVPASEIERIERTGDVQRTTTLRAPVSGFVVEKNVLPGQRVMAGDALYRIADLRTVWVEGEVFERDLSSIRLGQRVAVEVDAMPGASLSGRITYLYPTLDPQTRTLRVRVELANPALRLKPGMYATLHWHGVGRASALSVPRTAVMSTGQRHLVFVLRADGMLEPRLVQVGETTEDRVQVLSGIAPGDSVVRSATFLVDAESNLGTLLGGMGDMPGMDMTAPTTGAKAPTPAPRAQQKPPEDHSAHANH